MCGGWGLCGEEAEVGGGVQAACTKFKVPAGYHISGPCSLAHLAVPRFASCGLPMDSEELLVISLWVGDGEGGCKRQGAGGKDRDGECRDRKRCW